MKIKNMSGMCISFVVKSIEIYVHDSTGLLDHTLSLLIK